MRAFVRSRRTILTLCRSCAAVLILLSTPPAVLHAAQTTADKPEPASQLDQLAATQQAALDSGDPDRILASSRQLAALAERLLGNLDREQARFSAAADRYRKSLTLQDLPSTRLDLALNHVLAGHPDEALAECARIPSTPQPDPIALEVAAQAYHVQGNTAGAADALTHAWQIQPEIDRGARLITADLQAGRSAHAQRIAAEMLANAGETARLHLALAEAHHNAGDLNGTIADLTRAVALNPESSVYRLALGNAFWELNENQYNSDSLREFQAAQRLSPADFLSNYDLGSILSQYHRFAEADLYLKLAAAANPASPDPWLQLGMNAYQQERASEARLALEKAVNLTGSAEAQNNFQIRRAYAVLSRICAEEGREAEAAAYAARAEDLHAKLLRSNVQFTLSQSTALSANLSTTPNRPSSASPQVGGSPSPRQQQIEEQLQAIAAHSFNDAGTVLARSRDYVGALPLFREAAAADPTLMPAVRNLGIAAFRTGSFAEAISAFTKVLAQNPADNLAQTYLDQARSQPSVAPGKP